jgi:Ca2+-binding RTX toxin-like protein
MGRLLGVVCLALALGLLAVPGACAAPDPAALAAEMPTPSCAEGPQRKGEVIVGTPCADHIVVPPTVTYVDGGPGDDMIEGSLTTAASGAVAGSCEVECHLEVGSQTFEGGAGDDIVYGDRGNDILRGNAGDDRLYGGIGDDRLEGGPGNDWLSGGFGADTIDGQEGDDYVRGDGTIDHIFDTGGGTDTLSFATGVTPGFGEGKAPKGVGFPEGAEGERGVFLDLGAGGEDANNGVAASGGGVDVVQPEVFERIIGSPFSDYIVGTPASEEIIGGGGADVIIGGGGKDKLLGGADGDLLEVESGSESTIEGGAGPTAAAARASKAAARGRPRPSTSATPGWSAWGRPRRARARPTSTWSAAVAPIASARPTARARSTSSSPPAPASTRARATRAAARSSAPPTPAARSLPRRRRMSRASTRCSSPGWQAKTRSRRRTSPPGPPWSSSAGRVPTR